MRVCVKNYEGFESAYDLDRDMSEIWHEPKMSEVEGEFQGTLSVTVDYYADPNDIIQPEEELFFVIKSDEDYIEMGNGNFAVPKLYRKGNARALAKRRNKDENTDVYIVVPANIAPINKRDKIEL